MSYTDMKIFPKCGFGCVTCLHWHILLLAEFAEVKSPIWLKYFLDFHQVSLESTHYVIIVAII